LDDPAAAARQETTARKILRRFAERPGLVLADEVGMGKTFVALAVASSVALANPDAGPIVVMVPPSLKEKWPRDWSVFQEKCLRVSSTSAQLRATPQAIESGVEFLRLLDDSPGRRKHLIFLTHGALSRGLNDPWVKLALIRRAFRRSSLNHVRRAFPRFAAALLYMSGRRHMKPQLFEELLDAYPDRWRRILKRHGEVMDDDPVPTHLVEEMTGINLDELADGLSFMPQRTGELVTQRIAIARDKINAAFRNLWNKWLTKACRRSALPLLILDEAHHLKNSQTRLASLFRTPEAEVEAEMLSGALSGVFERMLFLTATPFQLGHHELLSVLERFQSIAWQSASAPIMSRAQVREELSELRQALDRAQRAALDFDRVWGRLRADELRDQCGNPISEDEWWANLLSTDAERSGIAFDVLRRYGQANAALREAERRLRPWVIRHLKPRSLPDGTTHRRELLTGAAISGGPTERGIEVEGNALLPFLLAARAQAVVAANHSSRRALFAEGLASSYEAYCETRQGAAARDEDDGYNDKDEGGESDGEAGISWYLESLDRALPLGDDLARGAHPKVAATVKRAIELWRAGEKALIFCHYRATGRALHHHISRELDREIMSLAAIRFGQDGVAAARHQLEQLGERFQKPKDRLRREADASLMALAQDCGPFDEQEQEQVIDVMRRFLRTPSFLARYFPPDGSRRKGAIAEALAQADESGLTLRERLAEFCRFLSDRCTADERAAYLAALKEMKTGTYKEGEDIWSANVRLVNGATDDASRRRLLLAFNTPFFPEILVASSVLAEGVDLHLDCRYVIHHDLCWNPSTLEQRTGRVDRLGAKAERARKSIHVYLPYVAATQDEKMFRVVRDRERWFQVVMGEKYELDEAGTDRHAARVLLPETAALSLAFRLEVWPGQLFQDQI
jgi:ERCC4-related helicase